MNVLLTALAWANAAAAMQPADRTADREAVAPPSAFILSCLGSGGTAGTLTMRSGSNRLLIYSASLARLSLSLAPSDGVSYIQLAVTEPAQGEPTNPTIRPGEGIILMARRLAFDSLGGTVGKSVEYCLRPV